MLQLKNIFHWVSQGWQIRADVPIGNLPSKQADEIMNIFKRLNEERVTIVQATHSKKMRLM